MIHPFDIYLTLAWWLAFCGPSKGERDAIADADEAIERAKEKERERHHP